MTRIPLVVGNWKMELSYKAAIETVNAFKNLLKNNTLTSEVVICPSFPVLAEISQLVEKSKKIQLGAQNVHWEEKGAWTGEVSVTQLLPLVKWCIIGHSERRALTGETDEEVRRKAELLLRHGITPIVCIGETMEERQAEQTVEKITTQMAALIEGTPRSSLSKIVIAYEPIWAIGTGLTPEPSDASQTMLLIRKLIAEKYDHDTAERIRLLYGGSVKAANIASFMAEPGIDGALVGGASVHPMEFMNIIKAVQEVAARA